MKMRTAQNVFLTLAINLRDVCWLLFCLFSSLGGFSQAPIHYKQPARNWNEALPIGNGRLGVMTFGRVEEELLQLNEETLWSGGPVAKNPNPDAINHLPEVRAALNREDYETASKELQKIQGLYTEAYQPLGDLLLRQPFNASPTHYFRDLDIQNATTHTQFTIEGVTYNRELLVSGPDQVMVLRLTASQKGKLNFKLAARSPHPIMKQVISKNELRMRGKAPAHADPNYVRYNANPVYYEDVAGCKGMRFDWRIKVQKTDGKVTTDTSGVAISGATEAVLLVTAATSFNGFDKCPDSQGRDEKALVESYLRRVDGKSFSTILNAHIADYQKYFNRVKLSLGQLGEASNLAMDARLMRYAQVGNDPQLEALYFQFGRYLLISSSRPGGIPANLQGIWNPMTRPPWSSNYTTNINAEMNYWPAEAANLSELHTTFTDWIANAAATGRETTKNFYGMSGWTVHHNSDIWGASNPVGDKGKGSPSWANWAMGGAWLSQHLWEHYAYSGDEVYLKLYAYPLMREAAQFCLDWLVKDADGRWITSPATSPENVFITEKGVKNAVSVATTMDMALVYDLFTNVIQAAEHLETDADLRKTLDERLQNLFPLQIGKKGNLQEWYKDWEDVEPQHRHVSHLFALHPGRYISPLRTPIYTEAAKKTLEIRGDGGTGWSKSWKINFWARLHDGNHAHKLLQELLKVTGMEGTDYANAGGTYPNLFCAHPPFQIDGNFGGTSGMIEMLLQSHDGVINLLPALPDEWVTGEVKGLKARGGFEIDMIWKDKKITRLTIKSALGGNCRLKLPNALISQGLQKANGKNSNHFYQVFENKYQTTTPEAGDFVYDLNTEKKEIYILSGN